MAQRSDWLPAPRTGQLTMAKNWAAIIPAKEKEWNISAKLAEELAQLVKDAETALATAQNEETRTPVATAKCNAAFAALIDVMRGLKRRYFMAPPLSSADLISLGLKPKDASPTPVPPPSGFPEGDVSYPGVGALDVHLRPVAGQPPLDSRSDYGYRVYFGVYPPGGADVERAVGKERLLMKTPANGDELPHSLWARRAKERMYFNGQSGMTAYFCVRYENSKGDKGPWGPLFSAIIP